LKEASLFVFFNVYMETALLPGSAIDRGNILVFFICQLVAFIKGTSTVHSQIWVHRYSCFTKFINYQ